MSKNLLKSDKPIVISSFRFVYNAPQRFEAWRKCGLELSGSSIQTELSQSQFLFANLKIKANKIGFWRLNKHKSSTLHLIPLLQNGCSSDTFGEICVLF